MKNNLILIVLAFVLIGSSLSGCCSRCQNQPGYSAVPAAGTGTSAQSYAAPASSGGAYSSRHSTK